MDNEQKYTVSYAYRMVSSGYCRRLYLCESEPDHYTDDAEKADHLTLAEAEQYVAARAGVKMDILPVKQIAPPISPSALKTLLSTPATIFAGRIEIPFESTATAHRTLQTAREELHSLLACLDWMVKMREAQPELASGPEYCAALAALKKFEVRK